MENVRDHADFQLNELLKTLLISDQVFLDEEAIHAFSYAPAEAIPVEKERLLVNQAGRNNWKWFILIAAVIGLFTSIYINNRNSGSIKKDIPINSKPEETPIANAQSEISNEPALPSRETQKPKGRSSLLIVNDSLDSDQNLNSDISNLPAVPVAHEQMHAKKDTSRKGYNIPPLTQADRKENERLKLKLIRSIAKRNKNEWGAVPAVRTKFGADSIINPKPFYISATEVTNQQYRIFLNDLIVDQKFDDYLRSVPDTSKWVFIPYFQPMMDNYFWHPAYDRYPVVNVSREGVQMFCAWLRNEVNEYVAKEYPQSKQKVAMISEMRIPSEKEWMVAAAGGKHQVIYPWGGTEIQNAKGCHLANFNVKKSRDLKTVTGCTIKFPDAFTSAGLMLGSGYSTVDVWSYSWNGYNLFNMSGNVAEMVDREGQPGTKGGSWNSDAAHLQITADDEYKGITEASPFIGFRPVFFDVK